MALGFGNAVLADFVEQSFVADLQQPGCLFTIPVGLFERLADGFAFSFIFSGAGK